MKKLLLPFLLAVALVAAAFSAETIPATGYYVDLYGNLFKNGQNLNRKLSDYARDPVNFADGPALDAALTDVALRGRTYIAEQIATKETEKQTAIAAAEQARDAAIAANASALASAQEAAATVPAKDAEIAAKTATIAEKEAALSAAQAALASKEAELAEKTAALATKATYVAALRGQLIGAGLTPVEETP